MDAALYIIAGPLFLISPFCLAEMSWNGPASIFEPMRAHETCPLGAPFSSRLILGLLLKNLSILM